MHSGILKYKGEKSYHPYLSDDRTHDQKFAKVVIEEMLSEVQLKSGEYILIESDNCSSQYKSAEHYHDMQDLCNNANTPLIRVYGISGHGKSEVDHVGGLPKVAIRREITNGAFLSNSAEMVEFLNGKFSDSSEPTYKVVEVDSKKL